MRSLATVVLCLILSACAGPIAAWKGRAYGEHSLNPGSLITMSGTFRTGRVHQFENGAVFLCLEPFPEVAAIMGGATKLTGEGFGIQDDATPVSVKGHESSTKYQEASLAYTIACNARINGVLEVEEYKKAILDILADLRTTKSADASSEKTVDATAAVTGAAATKPVKQVKKTK